MVGLDSTGTDIISRAVHTSGKGHDYSLLPHLVGDLATVDMKTAKTGSSHSSGVMALEYFGSSATTMLHLLCVVDPWN